MKQYLFLAALLIAVPISTFSQTPAAPTATASPSAVTSKSETAEQAVLRIESELRDAMLKSDVAVLERIIADEWVVQNPDTSQHVKSQLLEFYRATAKAWISIKDEDVAVKVYGNSAVVTGTSTRMRVGKDAPARICFTRIYTKRPSGWQIVGMQFHSLS